MKVIFVCTGNTCRSPLAEGFLKAKKLPNVTVESRGLCANASTISEGSLKAAKEYDIDLSDHISKQFAKTDLDADKIICMSPSHCDALLSYGAKADNIIVLGDGIFDPYGQSDEIYSLCARQIYNHLDQLVFSGEFGDFLVIPTEHHHIKDIARLERECFSEPWSENAITESLAAGTHFFTCLDKNKNVAGYLGISAVLDEGYITNVAVFKQYRRKGVATLLLNYVISFALQKGLKFISLEVRASNINAISIYEKFGFKTCGIRKNFYREPNEDAIIMTRRFDL